MPTRHLLRRFFRRKKRPIALEREKESDNESNSTERVSIETALEFQPLELPLDLRSSPFSKACFSAPVSELPRLQRLQELRGQSCESFRLLDLPTELRLSIFAMHFNKRTVCVTFCGEVTKTKRWFSCDSKHRNQNNCAILSACTQICKEAADVLWDCTTFVVKVGEMSSDRETDEAFFPLYLPLGPLELALGNMRRAVFMIEVSTRQSAVHLVLPELARGCGLRTAELHFDFGAVISSTKSPSSDRVIANKDTDLAIDVNSIVRQFVNMKVDCIPEASCVKLEIQSQRHGTRDKWTCVPCNEIEAYKLLLRKFKAYVHRPWSTIHRS